MDLPLLSRAATLARHRTTTCREPRRWTDGHRWPANWSCAAWICRSYRARRPWRATGQRRAANQGGGLTDTVGRRIGVAQHGSAALIARGDLGAPPDNDVPRTKAVD